MTHRYDRQQRISNWNQQVLTSSYVVIVGLGATGSRVAEDLASLGVGKIVGYDMDNIEITNLNRQPLYAGKIGEPKARVLEERLTKINPDVSFKGHIDEINKASAFAIGSPDVIVDCLDNMSTRAILNEYAVRKKLSLVSGGTSAFKGQVAVYIPGKTPCLDCQLNVYTQAKNEKDRDSCAQEPEPSIVTTNRVISAIMSDEVRKILFMKNKVKVDKYDKPLSALLLYDSFAEQRFVLYDVSKKERCKC